MPQLNGARLARAIREQREWIESCGGTPFGYLLAYGSVNHPGHSGDGGEAIYAADAEHLARLVHMRLIER